MSTRGAGQARLRTIDGADGTSLPRALLDPRAILTSIGEVVYDWDITTDAISWGLNAADVLGADDAPLLPSGRAYSLMVEPGSGRTRHDAIFESSDRDEGSGVPYRTHYAIRVKDRVLAIEDAGRWFAGLDGQPAFAHGVIRVDRASGPEAGTGGLGAGPRERASFLDHLGADLADVKRLKRPLTLVVASIDELGRLNEDLGYEGADTVICEVLSRIRTVLRRRDRLVRYAGNRFAIALTACAPDKAAGAARRLAGIVEASPIVTARGPLVARLRIGAATAPEHADDAPGLLRRAEDALLVAKRGSGRTFVLYDPSLSREIARQARGAPAFDVVKALNDRRVLFARQPIVDARSRTVAFSEALMRIRDAQGRLVTAGDILPGVERSGLVPLIDGRMLELTTDYLAAHPDERLAINVSPVTIETTDWLATLAAHLGARAGVAPRLIIEITETAAVRDPEATRARLAAMKALGVAIAIDDFGAGHTSFRHLLSFPVDILKIDGAFVQNLSRSNDDRFFVRTLVDLAHHLGIRTVAEWVEDEATAQMLGGWGIDYLQGEHCGAPVMADREGGDPSAGTG